MPHDPILKPVTIALCVFGCACARSGGDASADPGPGADEPAAVATATAERSAPGRVARLLADGRAVFGIFSGDHTAEQGAEMATNREVDFVFYSLETGPFDLPALQAYMRGLARAAGPVDAHPVLLRIPPIRDGRELALERIRQSLDLGVEGLVFPHVESRADAELGVEAMGDGTWPGNTEGRLVNVLLVEDRVGMSNAAEIVATSGASVVIPGPGDLSRAYDGDEEAVEDAIQTVLALCLAHDVPCGITADTADVVDRLEQGFRVIIARDPATVTLGREWAGR